jgi:hypothetical protein
VKYVNIHGEKNIANASHQTIIGKLNEADENALFIIGNGNKEIKDEEGNIT